MYVYYMNKFADKRNYYYCYYCYYYYYYYYYDSSYQNVNCVVGLVIRPRILTTVPHIRLAATKCCSSSLSIRSVVDSN
jgi:hypothetical protein